MSMPGKRNSDSSNNSTEKESTNQLSGLKKEQEKKLKDMRIQKREFATEISKMLRSAKWLD